MIRIRIASLVLMISLLVLAGCVSPGHHGESRASRKSVSNQTGLSRIPYEVPKATARLTLSLSLHASEGSFTYALTDPRGTPMWQGQVAKGQTLNESRTFKPLPGKWVLTLTLENTSGSYDVTWKSD